MSIGHVDNGLEEGLRGELVLGESVITEITEQTPHKYTNYSVLLVSPSLTVTQRQITKEQWRLKTHSLCCDARHHHHHLVEIG